MAKSRWSLGIVVAIVYAFMLIPTLIVIPVSVTTNKYVAFPPSGFTLHWYRRFFSYESFMTALSTSLRLAFLATVCGIAIGLMATLGLSRLAPRAGRPLRVLYLGPLVIPRIILGSAILIVFSRVHLSGTFLCLLLAHILVVLPFALYIISANHAQLDPRLAEAATSLGANGLRVFLTITLPLLKSALLAAAIVGFVVSFDELEMSLFLTAPDVTTLPVTVYYYMQYNSDPIIAAMSVVVTLATSSLVFIAVRFFGLGRAL